MDSAVRSRMSAIVCLLVVALHLKYADAEPSCNETGTGAFIPLEKQLLHCLMKNYDTSVRPARTPNDTIEVFVDSTMTTIIDLDEKTNTLTTEMWIYQSWTDVQLTWNMSEYPGIEKIHIPIDKIWTPSIVLHNNADETFQYVMDKLAEVDYTGKVTWIPHGRLKSRCRLDLTRFPFDTQICHLWFAPWYYDKSFVDVKTVENKHPLFIESTAEWDIDDFRRRRQELPNVNKSFATIVFTVKMHRTSSFFKYMLVGPSIALAVLTLALFWIPPNSGERFMLASGVLVALTMLLAILEGYLPLDIGRLPAIALFLGYNLALLIVTVIISILVFNFYHRDDRRSPVPMWMRKIFLGVASRLMGVGSVQYARVPTDGTSAFGDAVYREGELRERQQRSESNGLRSDGDDVDLGSSAASQHLNKSMALEQTLDEIRRYLRVLANKSNSNELQQMAAPSHRELVVGEWHQVALVVDRLSFLLFLFITVICAASIYHS